MRIYTNKTPQIIDDELCFNWQEIDNKSLQATLDMINKSKCKSLKIDGSAAFSKFSDTSNVKNIKKIAQAIGRHKGATKLFLINPGFFPKMAYQPLFDAMKTNSTLTELVFYNEMPFAYINEEISKTIAAMLKSNDTLKVLKLSTVFCSSNKSTMGHIADALKENGSLERLSVSIQDDPNPRVESLGASDKSIALLAKALEQNTTLKYLDLSRSDFGKASLEAISALLDKNNQIEEIVLNLDVKTAPPEWGAVISELQKKLVKDVVKSENTSSDRLTQNDLDFISKTASLPGGSQGLYGSDFGLSDLGSDFSSNESRGDELIWNDGPEPELKESKHSEKEKKEADESSHSRKRKKKKRSKKNGVKPRLQLSPDASKKISNATKLLEFFKLEILNLLCDSFSYHKNLLLQCGGGLTDSESHHLNCFMKDLKKLIDETDDKTNELSQLSVDNEVNFKVYSCIQFVQENTAVILSHLNSLVSKKTTIYKCNDKTGVCFGGFFDLSAEQWFKRKGINEKSLTLPNSVSSHYYALGTFNDLSDLFKAAQAKIKSINKKSVKPVIDGLESLVRGRGVDIFASNSMKSMSLVYDLNKVLEEIRGIGEQFGTLPKPPLDKKFKVQLEKFRRLCGCQHKGFGEVVPTFPKSYVGKADDLLQLAGAYRGVLTLLLQEKNNPKQADSSGGGISHLDQDLDDQLVKNYFL